MNEQLRYRVDSKIKKKYDDFIMAKYGHKQNRCGLELSKWIKLGLTVNGGFDYGDDPDVKEMIQSIKEDSPCTHTHHHEDDEDKDLDTNWNDPEYLEAKVDKAIDERFDEFEKVIKKTLEMRLENIEQKLENKYAYAAIPTNKSNPMDVYMAAFIKEYGEWTQVSYSELSHLAVQVHGVSDKRSVQNRINYLVGKGVIKEFSNNVYDVIH